MPDHGMRERFGVCRIRVMIPGIGKAVPGLPKLRRDDDFGGFAMRPAVEFGGRRPLRAPKWLA